MFVGVIGSVHVRTVKENLALESTPTRANSIISSSHALQVLQRSEH